MWNTIKVCECCGQEFRAANLRQTFCSPACKATPTYRMGLICETCRQPIPDRDAWGNLKRRKYCSTNCSTEAQKGRQGYWTGKGRPKPPCLVCGEPVKKHGKLHCSRACLMKSGLPHRPKTKYVDGPDPTEQEITERAAAIRQSWSRSERLRRLRVDERPVAAELKLVSLVK